MGKKYSYKVLKLRQAITQAGHPCQELRVAMEITAPQEHYGGFPKE